MHPTWSPYLYSFDLLELQNTEWIYDFLVGYIKINSLPAGTMVYVYHDGPDPLPEEAPTNDRRPVHDATGHFAGRYRGSKPLDL